MTGNSTDSSYVGMTIIVQQFNITCHPEERGICSIGSTKAEQIPPTSEWQENSADPSCVRMTIKLNRFLLSSEWQ